MDWFHFCGCCIGLFVILFFISFISAIGTNGDIGGLIFLFGGIFFMIIGAAN